MRVLRGTLTFVLGIIIGIILFVLAIGGTIIAIGTTVTLGDLQNKVGVNIIKEDSEAYNATILDTVKKLVGDIKNFDKLSVQEIINKYGIPLPTEIAGIDISAAYQYPISELDQHISDIVNSVSLEEIGDAVGIEWDEIDFPIVKENLENGISDAINAILQSINDEMSISELKDNFGIDIGTEDNIILKKLEFIPLTAFGSTINFLTLNDLLDANTDTYINKSSAAYVKASANYYQEVSKADLKNADYIPAHGIETYVAGTYDSNNDGKKDALLEKELRYIKKGDEYVVDNSCYGVDFNADTTDKVFYRHIEYVESTGETGVDYYIESYANAINVNKELVFKGFVLAQSNTIANINTPLHNTITSSPISPNTYYNYGDVIITKDTKLVEAIFDSTVEQFILYEEGSASAAVKSIAYKTLDELQNDDKFLDNMTLGEVIDIDDDSSRIMISLQNEKLGDISTAVDKLYLYEIMDITMDNYTADENGLYVKINDGTSYYYTMYNPAYHYNTSMYTRYKKSDVTNASSAVLQRLRTAKLGTFSDDFKTLVLSDVIDIVPMEYTKISKSSLSSDEDYYYYDSAKGLYLLADQDYIDDATHTEFYEIKKLGEGTKILQRLAYVKIDDLSESMEIVVDNALISDMVEIIDAYAVKQTASSAPTSDNDYFILEDTDGDGIEYIYDNDGKYVKRNYSIKECTPSKNPDTVYLTFTKVTDKKAARDALEYNILFYKNAEDDYVYNPQLCTYVMSKPENAISITTDNLFIAAIDSNPTGNAYTVYNDDDLYIESQDLLDAGSYVKYKTDQISHIVQTKFYKYDSSKVSYMNINGTMKNGDGYDGSEQLYSKVNCETIYVQNLNGDYVLFDNNYVKYNENKHADFDRYDKVNGYLATTLEVYKKSSGTYSSPLTTMKVEIVKEKSANLLSMLKTNKTTMNNMGNVTKNIKLKDVMDIDPDSIFSITYTNGEGTPTTLQECNIEDLSLELSYFLSSLKIGDLLNAANISGINEKVRAMIKDVDLTTFFESLTYNPSVGIVVDLEKIYA